MVKKKGQQKTFILRLSCCNQQIGQIKAYQFFLSSTYKTLPLYRGSQKAAVSRFLNTHGKKKHTVILCTTTKDLIIGAYSPASHLFFQQEQENIEECNKEYGLWVTQQYNDIFPLIFSVTNNQVYAFNRNQKQKKSIFRCLSKSKIMFGSKQFFIQDKQQKVKFYSITGSDGKLSYKWSTDNERFHGFKGSQFKVKKWEIWQIQYQQFVYSKILEKQFHKQLIIESFKQEPQYFQKLNCISNQPEKIKKFLNQYGQQQNLLFLLKVQGNKIFALFSAPSLKTQSNNEQKLKQVNDIGQWVSDLSQKSFVYSISQKKKYKLKNSQKAIFRCKSKKAICFGNGEFIIGQNAGFNLRITHKINDNERSYIEDIKQEINNGKQTINSKQNIKKQNIKQNKEDPIKVQTKILNQIYTIQSWQTWKISFEKEQHNMIQDEIKQKINEKENQKNDNKKYGNQNYKTYPINQNNYEYSYPEYMRVTD